MIKKEEADLIALQFLKQKGIEVIGSGYSRIIDGSIRAEYLPREGEEFWLVTFKRVKPTVDDHSKWSEEDLEILDAAFQVMDSVTVAVEMDGSARVV